MNNRLGRIKRPLFIGAFLLVIGLGCLSSQATDDSARFLQQIWQARDGLPSPVVRSVLQSRDGYLWAATASGLVRFDGSQFTVFDVRLSDPNRSFVPLRETADGSLWTASGTGVARIKDSQTTFYTTNDGLPSDVVMSVYPDSHGGLWVGTSKGVGKLRATNFVGETDLGSFTNSVRAILEDKNGAMWFGTSDGLVKLENGKTTVFKQDENTGNSIQCLCLDRDGSLWVGSRSGLGHLQNGQWTHYNEGHGGLLHHVVRALYQDAEGTLWIGTLGGAQRFAHGVFSSVDTSGETAANFAHTVPGYIYSICGDNEGDIWIGSYAGLNQLKKQPYRLYQAVDGLPANSATSVLQGRNGDMWIGTWEGGLTRLHDDQFTSWSSDQGLSPNIRALCEDRQTNLWVGTDGDGLFRLTDGKVSAQFTIEHSPGLADNTVRAICEDHRGALWIGGASGLTLWQNGVFKAAPHPVHDVKTIIEDRKGRVWVGSTSGLTWLADGSARDLGRKEGIPGAVNTIHEDSSGVVWVGTDSGWILRATNDVFAPLPLRGAVGRVLQILEDNAGNLWFSADDGVFRLSKAQRETLASGGYSAANPVLLTRLEGMQRLQCNGVAQPSGWTARDGRVWLPTLAGVMSIDANGLRDYNTAPPVIIEEALADGAPIARGQSLLLPAAGAPVEFDFTTLSLHSPGPAQFKYQLEGYDKHWMDVTDHRVRYASLPPGDFKFRVKAANAVGTASDKGAEFEFTVAPHFYQTSSFYGICGLLGLLGIARTWSWTQNWRARVMRKRDEEVFQLINQWTRSLQQEVGERKEAQRALQESQDLTLRQERLTAVGQLAAGLAHEFNNILTIIQGHASMLLDNPALDEDSVKSITHITDGVERTAGLVKQMLAFSRKQVMQRTVVQIKETMGEIAHILSGLMGAHISLEIDIAPDVPCIFADAEMLQQIIVNLAVNARDALSSGGQLTITANDVMLATPDLPGNPDRHSGHFVRLSVADSGPGMDSETIQHIFEPFFTTKDVGKGSGLGLATAYGMVKQNSGWIEVESAIGEGTTFHIFFPVHQGTAAPADPKVESPAPRQGSETILMVEDEAVLRELVREILQSHGYRVLEAGTGWQAMQLWGKHACEIDLLLTDIALPDSMTGVALWTQLRGDNARLPVIFSSGYTRASIERKERAVVGQPFLSKPYQPADLINAVRTALDGAECGEPSLLAAKT